MDNNERSLGFYAPVRVLPYLGKYGLFKGFRFFDDTNYWHRKYFDGIRVPIENVDDLKRKPVTDLIIMTPAFGNIIQEKVNANISDTNIYKLTDFYVD